MLEHDRSQSELWDPFAAWRARSVKLIRFADCLVNLSQLQNQVWLGRRVGSSIAQSRQMLGGDLGVDAMQDILEGAEHGIEPAEVLQLLLGSRDLETVCQCR